LAGTHEDSARDRRAHPPAIVDVSERPKLLDLYCGAGGASTGYAEAGFDVIGVDIAPQPHYPFPFVRLDALQLDPVYLDRFDLIHASPPCQRYSGMSKRWDRSGDHPDLIGPTRELLFASGVPFVIENVQGAPLLDALTLCGSMFGLRSGAYQLRRHRLFEAHGVELWPAPAQCAHSGPALPVYGHAGGRSVRDGLSFPGTAAWREGMGISWMTGAELAESIPPAFTQWVGGRAMTQLRTSAILDVLAL